MAVFEQIVPRQLCSQLAALVANATAAERAEDVEQPDEADEPGGGGGGGGRGGGRGGGGRGGRSGARRLTAHAPAGGLVGEAVALVAERLGRFLSAALGAPPGEVCHAGLEPQTKA